MPRPHKPRWIDFEHSSAFYAPLRSPTPGMPQVLVTIDELEALRLADLQGLSQEQAAEQMNVSRATFGRIVARGRRKIAEALVHGKGICIAGGVVQTRPPYGRTFPEGPHGRHRRGRGPRW